MKLGLQSLSLPPSKPTSNLPPPRPTRADCGVQATPPPPPVRSFANASSQASPPTLPVRVLADATSQTTALPPRVLADAASQTVHPATPPPRPTWTTSRSPTSPSPRPTVDEVLARSTALRKEAFPPPPWPPTPRAVSPAPCADVPNPSITVVVPYDTTSLSVDRVGHPTYAWRFRIATAPPTAPVQRGRPSRGRPLAAFDSDTSRPP